MAAGWVLPLLLGLEHEDHRRVAVRATPGRSWAVLVDARTRHYDVVVLDVVHERTVERVLAASALLRCGPVGTAFDITKDILLDLGLAATTSFG